MNSDDPTQRAQPLPSPTGEADFAATVLMGHSTLLAIGDSFAARPPTPHTLPGAPTGDDGVAHHVGRYEVKERLGRGGMASVFKAHDPSIARDVALKFLHAALCEDAECRSRFLREARAAGGLSHPNIVVVHDVGEIEGRPYMAMEMLTGQSLAEELEGSRQLPVRESVTVALQLARALDYAHKRGVVHRDIKPGNIMRDAASRTVKVTDFGIAHVEDSGTGAAEMRTRVGDVIGTPQYMSPEQARGEKLDGRSDLFSVGIVLYQMLTGLRPFRGDNLLAVATSIANEPHAPIDKTRKDVPASLRRLVDRCLAKSAAQRFQSGRELADALVKVRTEIDETARESNRPQIVPLRVKWAAAMALVVAIVMGATATLINHTQFEAMMRQVTDNGASLARFIAAQNAAAALGDDWEAVDVAVQEIMKTGSFERISVVDLGGIVRAASKPGLEGQPYKAPPSETLTPHGSRSVVTRFVVDGESVLGFEAPITFQGKRVGQVFMGIAEKPLTQVANLSTMLMVVLAFVTVLAVALATYVMANRFEKPVRLISEAMAEIGKGHFGHRMDGKPNDEFGLLFADFDAMAQALQDRNGNATTGASSDHTLAVSATQAHAAAPAKQG